MRTLKEAVAFYRETMAAHPHRDALAAEDAALNGVRRPHPTIYVHHQQTPDDTSTAPTHWELPHGDFPDTPEGRLAGEILGLLGPLDMLNPVTAVLGGGGRTVADLIPSFGVPLGADDQAPARAHSLSELLARPVPDPETSGWMPKFREHIRMVSELAPPEFRISMPNLQGPFNLLLAMASDDAFVAPLNEPDEYHAFMDRLTTFWIAAAERLMAWIGPDRLRSVERYPLISECAVNMVSADFYCEHILPYDLRIAKHFNGIRIHTCSGRHVFHSTLKHLPGVRATETGIMIAKMAAPCMPADEALEAIGTAPVLLSIGQELPEDPTAAFELIRADLDRYRSNPRLLFNYTGMFWRRKDRPMIRAMHERLDGYWRGRYG